MLQGIIKHRALVAPLANSWIYNNSSYDQLTVALLRFDHFELPMNAEGDWLAPLQARLSMESSIHVDPWWTVAETNRLGGCFVFDFELSPHFCN